MVENTGVEIPYCIFWISWCVQKKITLKYFGRNYTSNTVGLQNPSCNKDCPSRCGNQWEFYENSAWKLDRTIRIECSDEIVNKGK